MYNMCVCACASKDWLTSLLSFRFYIILHFISFMHYSFCLFHVAHGLYQSFFLTFWICLAVKSDNCCSKKCAHIYEIDNWNLIIESWFYLLIYLFNYVFFPFLLLCLIFSQSFSFSFFNLFILTHSLALLISLIPFDFLVLYHSLLFFLIFICIYIYICNSVWLTFSLLVSLILSHLFLVVLQSVPVFLSFSQSVLVSFILSLSLYHLLSFSLVLSYSLTIYVILSCYLFPLISYLFAIFYNLSQSLSFIFLFFLIFCQSCNVPSFSILF